MDIKKIITSKTSGFLSQRISVPEWGVELIIREPSMQTWGIWSEKLKNSDEDQDIKTKTQSRIEAEALLFSASVCNTDGELIFDDNLDDLIASYGPVHSRILNQALALSNLNKNPLEESKKN